MYTPIPLEKVRTTCCANCEHISIGLVKHLETFFCNYHGEYLSEVVELVSGERFMSGLTRRQLERLICADMLQKKEREQT
jgi:hypothetical protein